MSRQVFKLEIEKNQQSCKFTLSWESGQRITTYLDYPNSMMENYQIWRNAYVNYYRNALRARNIGSGNANLPVDWRANLRDTEERFYIEFRSWLESQELCEIRDKITYAALNSSNLYQNKTSQHSVDIFLICHAIELQRLPWEAWEVNRDLTEGIIRFIRTSANIRREPISRKSQGKARILVILGDDTGLNFEQETRDLRSLRCANVELVGWQPEKRFKDIIDEIRLALEDIRGWDVLFFLGHSNETPVMGGELVIAPGRAIYINDIRESLIKAQERGLQFSCFNSCQGMSIADSLIDLGLPQVAVMREPIHNEVAKIYLRQFLNSLEKYQDGQKRVFKDVHEAMIDARKFFKQESNRFDYPSAYLIPSLFCHPEIKLFSIKPFGFKEKIKYWLPKRLEIIWLLIFIIPSIIPFIQDLLLEPRVFFQAVYRQVTFQVPSQVESPLLLIRIDNDSLKANNITQKNPIDYSYLSKLVDKISSLGGKLVGIDYLLDTDKEQLPGNSQKLAESIRQAITRQKTWFVFAYQGKYSYNDQQKERRVSPNIASLNWSLEGNIYLSKLYVELPQNNSESDVSYPLAYLLSLSYSLLNQKPPPPDLPQPNLNSKYNFMSSVVKFKNIQDDDRANSLKKLLHNSVKFTPIIDFSLPSERAYESISACELLGKCKGKENSFLDLSKKVILIVSGGYYEADDNDSWPLAAAFWQGKILNDGWLTKSFPRGEIHAYMIHHLLTRKLVVPIPDLMMILLAAFLGKGLTLVLPDNTNRQKRWIIGTTAITIVYLVVALQIYISAAVLIPILFPSAIFWNYVRLALRRKTHG